MARLDAKVGNRGELLPAVAMVVYLPHTVSLVQKIFVIASQ